MSPVPKPAEPTPVAAPEVTPDVTIAAQTDIAALLDEPTRRAWYRRRTLWAGVLLLLLAGAGFWWWQQRQGCKQQPRRYTSRRE